MLKHELIPFVSYPYEWTFSQLKDAALVQLDLLLAALDKDLVLKDSSPYNVQWRGARPVFVDVGSFERMREGEPWVGYRQFCMLYLYPLLLQSAKDVRFHPWLRGSIDGITPAEMRGLMSFRDRFRRGLTTNVFLHARLERQLRRPRQGGQARRQAADEEGARGGQRAQDAQAGRAPRVGPARGRLGGLRRAQLLHRRRRPAQGRLRARGGHLAALAAWSGTSAATTAATRGSRRRAPTTWWPSTPTRARSSCSTARLRDEGDEKILPLTMNLADPSPGLGWRGLERRAMPDRGKPDLVLALALVHHVAISANVPVRGVRRLAG